MVEGMLRSIFLPYVERIALLADLKGNQPNLSKRGGWNQHIHGGIPWQREWSFDGDDRYIGWSVIHQQQLGTSGRELMCPKSSEIINKEIRQLVSTHSIYARMLPYSREKVDKHFPDINKWIKRTRKGLLTFQQLELTKLSE